MKILGNIREWNDNRKTQNVLNSLPDSILRDIGLVRYGKKVSLKH